MSSPCTGGTDSPAYDPFGRGPFPVGVRTLDARDAARDGRRLPIEVWYPAAAAHAGEDLGPASQDRYEIVPGFTPVGQEAVRGAMPRAGRWPLVAFSHGAGGHRRQSTVLTTHLASHGYVVAAVDHTGNTYRDIAQLSLAIRAGAQRPDTAATVRALAISRPADVAFMLAYVRGDDTGALIEPGPIGMVGHSLGGWTTLLVVARDPRLGAVVLLAPAGGASPDTTPALREALDFDWGRDVPALYLVAGRDTVSPLEGMRDLVARTRGSRRLVILENADHWHFCDRVEQVHEMVRKLPPPGLEREIARLPPASALCPGAHAATFVRGLGLAHFDAVLKRDAAAARFLGSDLRAALADRDVRIEVA